ncbi:hypothetical protein Taro_016328 [Colocasia esculenta]|uniref:Uncharacterized protein n=1 Tax=Colocasia esculenta TaxID=4460 RepID=A0A843UNI7_COLES|nr:hypothetical protein [Colocasia esculenta]
MSIGLIWLSIGFLLTPLVGHETDQAKVSCRQVEVICRHMKAICRQLLVELLYLGSGSMIPVNRWVLSVDSCGLNFQK